MMRPKHRIYPLLLLLLAFSVLLSGCDLFWRPEPFVTSTPWPTFTPLPSATPLPSVTPTATPYVPAQAGTPVAASAAVIAETNLKQLALLSRLGQGVPQELVWSVDGEYMAVASTRGLYLYAGRDVRLLRSVDIPAGPRSLAFSPDGAFLLSGNNDGSLSLWSTASGELSPQVRGHDVTVFSVAFSADGAWAASAAWDQTIRLWRISADPDRLLSLVRTLSGQNEGVRRIAFDPDGERLFSWSPRRHVQVWQTADGKRLDEIYTGPTRGGLTASDVHFASGSSLVSIVKDDQVRILRTTNGTTLSTLQPFRSKALRAVLSADGSLAATLDAGRKLKVWQANNGKLLHEISLPEEVEADALLTISPDNGRVIVLSGSFWVWELPADGDLENNQIQAAGYLPAFPFFTRFTLDGAHLTSGLLNGRLYQLPLAESFSAGAGRQFLSSPSSLAASADLARVAAGSGDQRLLIWDAGEDNPRLTSARQQQNLSALAFSTDGKLLASAAGYGKAGLWDVGKASQLKTLNVPPAVSALLFSADDSLLAVISRQGVQLWQSPQGELLHSLNGTGAAFSPDGKVLAVAGRDEHGEMIALHNLSAEDAPVLQRMAVSGNSLAFSPNGSLLAVSGKTLTILRVSDGKNLLELDPPLPFGEVFFSPDGTYLALSHWDGTVSLWGIP